MSSGYNPYSYPGYQYSSAPPHRRRGSESSSSNKYPVAPRKSSDVSALSDSPYHQARETQAPVSPMSSVFPPSAQSSPRAPEFERERRPSSTFRGRHGSTPLNSPLSQTQRAGRPDMGLSSGQYTSRPASAERADLHSSDRNYPASTAFSGLPASLEPKYYDSSTPYAPSPYSSTSGKKPEYAPDKRYPPIASSQGSHGRTEPSRPPSRHRSRSRDCTDTLDLPLRRLYINRDDAYVDEVAKKRRGGIYSSSDGLYSMVGGYNASSSPSRGYRSESVGKGKGPTQVFTIDAGMVTPPAPTDHPGQTELCAPKPRRPADVDKWKEQKWASSPYGTQSTGTYGGGNERLRSNLTYDSQGYPPHGYAPSASFSPGYGQLLPPGDTGYSSQPMNRGLSGTSNASAATMKPTRTSSSQSSYPSRERFPPGDDNIWMGTARGDTIVREIEPEPRNPLNSRDYRPTSDKHQSSSSTASWKGKLKSKLSRRSLKNLRADYKEQEVPPAIPSRRHRPREYDP